MTLDHTCLIFFYCCPNIALSSYRSIWSALSTWVQTLCSSAASPQLWTLWNTP